MGCCASRYSRETEQNDEEITKEILEKEQRKNEKSTNEKDGDKNSIDYRKTVTENFDKLEIDELKIETHVFPLDLLTDDIFLFSEDKETITDNDESETEISRTFSKTSEPGQEGLKRKKSSQLTEKYLMDPDHCDDVHIEDSYFIEDRSYHKPTGCTSFIETPLTVEDVLEVLSDNDYGESDQTNSIVSFDSFLISAPSETDEFPSYLTSVEDIIPVDNIYNNEGEVLSNEQGQICEHGDYKRSRAYSDKTFRPPVIFPLNICKSTNRQILNAVPDAYDNFRKSQKDNEFIKEKRRAFTDPSAQSSKGEWFSVLYHVNSKNQNILHQMVMKNDCCAARTVLICLFQMKQLNDFLESPDIFGNTPLSYSIQLGYVKMTKLLLEYHPIIPSSIFSASENDWIPTMQAIFKFLPISNIRNELKNSIFILICNYLTSLRDNYTLSKILEVKNKDDLTILHYAITKFEPKEFDIQNGRFDYEYIISYLYKIGSSLETKCRCASRKEVEVDTLGQAVLSRYPCEILGILGDIFDSNNGKITWHYIIDGMTYNLEELFSIRTDITVESRDIVIKKLRNWKNNSETK